jgi:hypothetical protein
MGQFTATAKLRYGQIAGQCTQAEPLDTAVNSVRPVTQGGFKFFHVSGRNQQFGDHLLAFYA